MGFDRRKLQNFIRTFAEASTRPVHSMAGRVSKRKLVDCLLFFNELDLLELRLKTIYPFVDRIVICEGARTMSGEMKPLHYRENARRFEAYHEKIIHLVAPPPRPEDFEPAMDGKPSAEAYQRRYLVNGLNGIDDGDIVMLSDVDEIPNPGVFDAVKGAIACGVNFATLRQHWHLLFINARVVESFNRGAIDDGHAWFGTMLCSRKTFRGQFKDDFQRLWGRKWGSAGRDVFKIDNGGWHFSYLGGLEKVMLKLRATVLQDVGGSEAEDLKKRIFVKARFDFVPLDESFPRDVRDNRQLYERYWVEPDAYDEAILPFLKAWAPEQTGVEHL